MELEIIKPSAPKSYPGSRGPFSKYQGRNKPCSRFDKAPEMRTKRELDKKKITSGVQGTKKLSRSLNEERWSFTRGSNYSPVLPGTVAVLLIHIGK